MAAAAPSGLSELEPVDLQRVKLDPACCRALPATGVRRFLALGLCRVDDQLIVATCNPRLAAVRQFVAARLQEPFRLVRVEEAPLRRLIAEISPPHAASGQADPQGESCETVQACDELLRAALLRGASDIHLLPEETGLQARLRVDGALEDYRSFPATLQAGMVSRLKVLAGMNIAEKRSPQDGRFAIPDPSTGNSVDVRAATIPTRCGERVTLRLLKPLHAAPSLSELGMSARALELFGAAAAKPNGLVLLTGPTGCGKSTTLYTTIVQLLRPRGGNIMTVEDPVEYDIPGTTQVEVDSAEKVSFTRVLRSVLRHDPDVIVLGEIRDAETAELAIKAALTGHLVFSTLHTNTAAGVVTRLTDMGVEPFLIAATLRLAVAQRLVRRLCPHCKTDAPLDVAQAAVLGRPQLAGELVGRAAGCVYCAGKGFAGRTALFEMLPGGDAIADRICRGEGEAELTAHMQRCGYPLLADDGIDKLLAGTTTAEQVLGAVTTW